jgi:hypothetical protein
MATASRCIVSSKFVCLAGNGAVGEPGKVRFVRI